MYPGVLCMAVMFTAMFSAASIVWDREFGFLREMMVAPVRRSSIVLGKCFGGATVAGFQGVIVLCLAGLVGVPYAAGADRSRYSRLQLLLAFAITAFGVMVAARITQMQSFMALMQMVDHADVLPLRRAVPGRRACRSGSAILNRLDPLTYAVDPMRRAVFAHMKISAAARHALDPGVTWWSWHVPGLVEAGVVALLGLLMLAIAIVEFGHAE